MSGKDFKLLVYQCVIHSWYPHEHDLELVRVASVGYQDSIASEQMNTWIQFFFCILKPGTLVLISPQKTIRALCQMSEVTQPPTLRFFVPSHLSLGILGFKTPQAWEKTSSQQDKTTVASPSFQTTVFPWSFLHLELPTCPQAVGFPTGLSFERHAPGPSFKRPRLQDFLRRLPSFPGVRG